MKKQLQMKGAMALFVGLAMGFSATAQTPNNSDRKDPTTQKANEKAYFEDSNLKKSTLPVVVNPSTFAKDAVLWSEDFASGFTGGTNGTWTTSGINANYVEYDLDGPDNLIPNGWGPLPSPTASNGFAIFDFYNRFPDPNGFATSPAEAKLTSPVINLGAGTTDAQIDLYMQLYNCCHATEKNMTIDISTDGGLTFPNSIVANADFDRNDRHWNLGLGYHFRWKISDYIVADPTNVVIRFNWTSTNADLNGQFDNTYFWMIDDITISDVPDHSLEFSALGSGAPAHDVIFDGDGANTKHGIMALGQATTIGMDGNIVNYGTVTQTNVKLKVDIEDDNGTTVTTLTSATGGTIAENDTLDFNTAFTSQTWTPSAAGVYNLIYSATSDSSNVPGFELQIDTFTLVVTNNTLHSMDWNAFSNNHGTNELGDDGSALASRLYFPNANVGAPSNHIYLEELDIRFSTQSTAGGEVLIEIQDTSIDLTAGFNNAPLFSKTFDVTAAMVGGTGTFDLRDSVWNPWKGIYEKFGRKLDANNSYYMVAYLFSNGGNSPVQIANDQTFPQPSLAAIMFNVADNRWYVGYTDNNLDFNAPWLRARFADTPDANIGLEEDKLVEFEVYPNPVTGNDFAIQITEGGTYSLELVNLSGQLIQSSEINVNGSEVSKVDVSTLAKGVYVLNVKGEKLTKSVKLTIK
tara:strand:+ start:37655 stop:39724 length:2070 start_codon:yes stop_codon:yes gene_type:complete